MPLAFDSTTHDTIAFGFFNIESDMLLLEHYFFFAPDFCAFVSALAGDRDAGVPETSLRVYPIPDREDIGDLMGAIHGIRHAGFIGEVYRRFPFPKAPEAFRQNPEGSHTRSIIETTIGNYARSAWIPVRYDEERGEVRIGEYGFATPAFQALIRYVWVGGYPRWKNEIRPPYVLAMKQRVQESRNPVFDGMVFVEP